MERRRGYFEDFVDEDVCRLLVDDHFDAASRLTFSLTCKTFYSKYFDKNMFGITPYVACLRAGYIDLVRYCVDVLRVPTWKFPYYELKRKVWSFDGLKYLEDNKIINPIVGMDIYKRGELQPPADALNFAWGKAFKAEYLSDPKRFELFESKYSNINTRHQFVQGLIKRNPEILLNLPPSLMNVKDADLLSYQANAAISLDDLERFIPLYKRIAGNFPTEGSTLIETERHPMASVYLTSARKGWSVLKFICSLLHRFPSYYAKSTLEGIFSSTTVYSYLKMGHLDCIEFMLELEVTKYELFESIKATGLRAAIVKLIQKNKFPVLHRILKNSAIMGRIGDKASLFKEFWKYSRFSTGKDRFDAFKFAFYNFGGREYFFGASPSSSGIAKSVTFESFEVLEFLAAEGFQFTLSTYTSGMEDSSVIGDHPERFIKVIWWLIYKAKVPVDRIAFKRRFVPNYLRLCLSQGLEDLDADFYTCLKALLGDDTFTYAENIQNIERTLDYLDSRRYVYVHRRESEIIACLKVLLASSSSFVRSLKTSTSPNIMKLLTKAKE